MVRSAAVLMRGSIPAHAGQTIALASLNHIPMVDPRSRGADPCTCWSSKESGGRSPLTRGRLAVVGLRCPRGGSIPAHAGQTRRRRPAAGRLRVDPRSRGADNGTTSTTTIYNGRSPLTRGRRTEGPEVNLRAGSIPAHAGQTVIAACIAALTGVDPRSRGADPMCAPTSTPARGRSPLTRGRHDE